MTHGHAKPPTATYISWSAMKTRCRNTSTPDYEQYGARGISYDPHWEDFENFLLDMGKRPAGTTLDRKNSALGYTKTNCRWATYAEQNQNRTGVKLTPQAIKVVRKLAKEGKTHAKIAAFFGVSRQTIGRAVARKSWTNL